MWLSMWSVSELAQVTTGDVPELNAQLFRPCIDAAGLLWADDAGKREEGFSGRLLLQYVDDPLVYVDSQGTTTVLVTSLAQTDLLGGYTFKFVRLGLDVPVYLYADGDRTGGE